MSPENSKNWHRRSDPTLLPPTDIRSSMDWNGYRKGHQSVLPFSVKIY